MHVSSRPSIHSRKQEKEKMKPKQQNVICKNCGKGFPSSVDGDGVQKRKELQKNRDAENQGQKQLYPDLKELEYLCEDCDKKTELRQDQKSTYMRIISYTDKLILNSKQKIISILISYLIPFLMRIKSYLLPILMRIKSHLIPILKLLSKVSNNKKRCLVIISIIVALQFLYFYSGKESVPEYKLIPINIWNQTEEEKVFDDELYNLEDTYPNQNEKVWYSLAAGIKSVISHKPNRPSVFLFLYDTEEAGKTAKCLIFDVVKIATRYLMKREMKPLSFAGAELNNLVSIEDPGKMLEDYNATIIERGIMVVTDLQHVNPEIATNFHFFCDSYSPLVEKSVYFFTLQINNFIKTPLLKIAEDYLNNLWSSLPDNKRKPLITRLTPNTLRIVSDIITCH